MAIINRWTNKEATLQQLQEEIQPVQQAADVALTDAETILGQLISMNGQELIDNRHNNMPLASTRHSNPQRPNQPRSSKPAPASL